MAENPWFRLYAEFATDPKVQMLSEANQRRYIMLLCLRCSNGDVTLHDDEVAFQLRISNEDWASTKSVLVAKGLIGEDNSPSAWDRRQYRSDSSAERVRRHRENKKQACNVTVTAPDTDTDTDTEVNLKPKPLSGGVHSSTSDGSENAAPPPDGPDPITLRAIELSALLHQRGAALQASDPRVRAWAERGISDAQALTALETAETRRAEKGSSQAINAGLLDAILSDLATDSPPRNRPPPAPRSPTLSDQRRAAATTRLSDVINDDGTPKPQQQKGFDDARTLDANAPRLVG